MTQAQALSLGLVAAAALLLGWRRLPAEVVAVGVLVAGVVAGAVPADAAFAGFGSAAVVTAAAAMLVSTAIARSGAVETLVRPLLRRTDDERAQATLLAGAVATFSATSRSGGLGTLLPFAAQLAARRRSSAAVLLVPMALAATVGGTLTLVGSVPNIIVAEARRQGGGAAFSLFSFTPVGLAVTAAGLALLWLGYRFLPDWSAGAALDTALHARGVTAEARLPADSAFAGAAVTALEAAAGRGGARVSLILREGFRRIDPAVDRMLREDDVLLLHGEPDDIERLISAAGLVLAGGEDDGGEGDAPALADADEAVREGVVTTGSPLVGITPDGALLRVRHRLRVLAVGRRDAAVDRRLRFVRLRIGDVLILKGPRDHLADAMEALRILPLSERPMALGARRRSWVPIAVLLAAVVLVALGRLPVPVAFLAAAVAVLLLGAMTAEEAYRTMNWPVLLTLGALSPVAGAMRASGASDLVAATLAPVAGGVPALLLIAVVVAAALIAASLVDGVLAALVLAPIATALAHRTGASGDALLMAVAVGATCAVLGPLAPDAVSPAAGRLRLGEARRLGAPVAIAVVIVGAPLIQAIWG